MQDAKQDAHGCSSGPGSQLSGQERLSKHANYNPPPSYPRPPMPPGPSQMRAVDFMVPFSGEQQSQMNGVLLGIQETNDRLCALAEAINRLAASNEALVQAMAEGEGMDQEERPATVGLNGRPL